MVVRSGVIVVAAMAALAGPCTASARTSPKAIVPAVGLTPADDLAKDLTGKRDRPALAHKTDKDEAAALKTWSKLASRKGAVLRLVLTNGKTATLTSNGECEGFNTCDDFTFVDYLPHADRLVVSDNYGEGQDMLLIDRRTGVFLGVADEEVHESPNGRLVISLGDYESGDNGRYVRLDLMLANGRVNKVWHTAEEDVPGQYDDDYNFVRWLTPTSVELVHRKALDHDNFGPAEHVVLSKMGDGWTIRPLAPVKTGR